MYTVLVTGVGAIIGYGIVRSLRALPFPVKIVGMDIYPDAVGQQWCDTSEQAHPASSPRYVEFLRDLLQRNRVDLVMPGIEQDIMRLTKDLDLFADLDTRFVLNTRVLVETAEDKWLLHTRLVEAGFPTIPTYIDGDFETLSGKLGLPFLLKPRRSYASKGIFQIETEGDFSYWKKKLGDNFMVQRIVGSDDQEYTAGAFGYGDGECSPAIVFQRRLSGEGATAKAIVVENPDIKGQIDKLCRLFSPVGPTNFQFRYHQGEYLLLEINPRISSSTSLRTAFGFNEAGMCIDFFLRGKRPSPGRLRTGRALRYVEDIIIHDSPDI